MGARYSRAEAARRESARMRDRSPFAHERARADAAARFGENCAAATGPRATPREVIRAVRRAFPDGWRADGSTIGRASRRVAYRAALDARARHADGYRAGYRAGRADRFLGAPRSLVAIGAARRVGSDPDAAYSRAYGRGYADGYAGRAENPPPC